MRPWSRWREWAKASKHSTQSSQGYRSARCGPSDGQHYKCCRMGTTTADRVEVISIKLWCYFCAWFCVCLEQFPLLIEAHRPARCRSSSSQPAAALWPLYSLRPLTCTPCVLLVLSTFAWFMD